MWGSSGLLQELGPVRKPDQGGGIDQPDHPHGESLRLSTEGCAPPEAAAPNSRLRHSHESVFADTSYNAERDERTRS